MPKVRWTRPAANDLDAIEAFLDQIDPSLAAKTITLILDVETKLGAFARRGSPVGDDRRSLPVDGTGYRVIYRVAGTIEILRVRHVRQDWRR